MRRTKGRHRAPAPHRALFRGRRRIVLGSLGAILTLALVLALSAYAKLNHNITRVDVAKMLGERPSTTSATGGRQAPVNILVMGSDTRQGIGT